ncbi:hypothetical protein M0R45_009828 [Rubus argutus]|uniref:Pentatricopeptide repeat-containing protein n=1 Tax=Rubus argutus TaxID=59490 RepID=A0AAW1Y5L9_RUBAR
MGGLGSAQLFFSSIAMDPSSTTLAANARDPSVANKLIAKFLSSSPKSAALTTLSYLLSPDTHTLTSPPSPSLYIRKSQKRLGLNGIPSTRERELALFHCQLVESHSKISSKRGFDSAYNFLYQLVQNSSSVYVKRRAFESMVSGLCAMDRPREAEDLIEEMRVKGVKPSVFEFRSVVYGYGRLGLFEEMLKIVDQMAKQGFGNDTICSNMVLSSYGAHNELAAMEPKAAPCSVEELNGILDGEEALVVKELVGSAVVDEAMVWDSSEAKLDLHGMHLGAAYLVMLEWFEAMRYSPMRIDRKNVGCFIAKGRAVKDWLC